MNGEPAPMSPIPLEERYRRLLGVSKVLGAIRDPEELIRALSNELQRILSFDHLSLFLKDVVGEGASWHIWHADDESVLSPVGRFRSRRPSRRGSSRPRGRSPGRRGESSPPSRAFTRSSRATGFRLSARSRSRR